MFEKKEKTSPVSELLLHDQSSITVWDEKGGSDLVLDGAVLLDSGLACNALGGTILV